MPHGYNGTASMRSSAFMHEGRKPFIDVGERFTVTPIVNGQTQAPIVPADSDTHAAIQRGPTRIEVTQGDIDYAFRPDRSPTANAYAAFGRSPVVVAMERHGYNYPCVWNEGIEIHWIVPAHSTYYPVPEDALRAEQLWNSGLPIAPFDFWFYPTEIEGNGPQTLTMPTI